MGVSWHSSLHLGGLGTYMSQRAGTKSKICRDPLDFDLQLSPVTPLSNTGQRLRGKCSPGTGLGGGHPPPFLAPSCSGPRSLPDNTALRLCLPWCCIWKTTPSHSKRSQEPAALIIGCAVTSISPNTEQRPTRSAEKAAVTATAAKQGERDNCGNKGGTAGDRGEQHIH